MRLNLGCGHEPLKGWTNVDAYAEEADVHGDIRELVFADVDEVMMSHVLEHISHTQTGDVLARVFGWLRPGGKLTVEVPDIEKICAKAENGWLRAVYGSQEHEGEYHRSGFTIGSLAAEITGAGFDVMLARRVLSENKHRPGMPCLRVVGVK